MSKKKRTSRKPAQASLSPEALRQRAADALAARDFKPAIEHYKTLLKREPDPAIREALAQAYLGRARELAAKGMGKEAATMWENRANACGVETEAEEYLGWLLQSGSLGKAMRLFQRQSDALPKDLPVRFCVAILGEANPTNRQQWIADAPWREGLETAEQILAGYCNGDDAATLEPLLKTISSRSPLRDFRLFIKILLTLETDPAKAREMAAKLPVDSPYAQLATLLPHPEEADDALVAATPLAGQEVFMAKLHGWRPEQASVAKALTEQFADKHPSSGDLVQFVLRHRKGLGDAYVARLARHWGPRVEPDDWDRLLKHYPLSHLEKRRVAALAIENEGGLRDAVQTWERALGDLGMDCGEPDILLQGALIQRRRIGLMREMGQKTTKSLERALRNCIEWTPEEGTSWLELITLLQQRGGAQKECNELIEKALQKFPRDVAVLLAAANAAAGRKAFKKAAGYAKQVLTMDPVNVPARQFLIDAHLSHAAKQFKAQKYHLVDKELTAAAEFERGAPNVALRIRRGLLAYAQGQAEDAREHLLQARQAAGSALACDALIVLACAESNFDAQALVQTTPKPKTKPLLPPWDKAYVPDAAEWTALTRLLRGHIEHGPARTFLLEWKALMKKSAKVCAQSLETLLLVCDFFKQTECYPLLTIFADEGVRHWRKERIFIFYEEYARVQGKFYWVDDLAYDRLETTLEAALAANDQRTALLIQNFISPGMSQWDADDEEWEDEDEEDEWNGLDSPLFGASPDDEPALPPRLKALFEHPDPYKLLEYLFDGKIPNREVPKAELERRFHEKLSLEISEGQPPTPKPNPKPTAQPKSPPKKPIAKAAKPNPQPATPPVEDDRQFSLPLGGPSGKKS